MDGERVDIGNTVAYKGMMLSGVPNLALTVGYTNASWTLKADLVASYVCRLLNHMDVHGYTHCTTHAPDPALPRRPFLDLNSGYVMRSIEELPKQSTTAPWRLHQSYPLDRRELRRCPLEDDAIEFARAQAPEREAAPIAA